MWRSVEGVYRDGRVDLLEPAPGDTETRVIVTFLSSGKVIDLAGRGIDERQAAGLRQRLKTFAEDWDRPEMGVYDED